METEGLPMMASSSPAILRGIRVIDFSRVLAGPFVSQMLGSMGADVVKVEPPGGDDSRKYGDPAARTDDIKAIFASFNCNKRSIVLDLKKAEGSAVALRLVKGADVLIHNFRPGVMDDLGLDYDHLKSLNPGLVYCEISGFGNGGALRSKRGNDLSAQAYSGLLSISGEPGREPVKCPVAIGDLSAGLYATIGVIGALLWRERSRRGQRVETSLFEGLVSLLSYYMTQYFMTGIVPQRMGTANKMGQPNQVFQLKDGLIAVSATSDEMWQRFCRAIGEVELISDPRFIRLNDRYQNREELLSVVSRVMREITLDDCLRNLEAEGVVCAPVRTLDEVAADPQLEVLNAIETVSAGDQTISVVKVPVHFSETPVATKSGPPLIGQHETEILTALGYTEEEITSLHFVGALG